MKSTLKLALLIISVISFILIFSLKFNRDYWATILLPVVYGVGILNLFKQDVYKYGPCSISLMCFYAFRMCLLPIICAWGNFYMEIPKNLYIEYYNTAIFLMCVEFIFVILATNYYCKRNLKKRYVVVEKIDHSILNLSAFVFVIIIGFGLVFIAPDYFHFILEEMERELYGIETEHKGMWYVLDLTCNIGRPLVCFVLVYYGVKKRDFWSCIVATIVIVSNFLFLSDHRIFSMLISGVCIYYVLLILKSKFVSTILQGILILAAIATIYVCFFYQLGEGNEYISRTFEHYFSGPSLAAIGLAANDQVDYRISDFFKILFNNFHVFNVLFGKYQVINYYDNVFGFSKGIWTPMFVSGIRYFGFLAPLFIIGFTKFVVFCDFKVKCIKDQLFQMIYVFLGVSLSCYMIMYKLELIVYFLMSTAVLYSLLVNYSKRRKKNLVHLKPRIGDTVIIGQE